MKFIDLCAGIGGIRLGLEHQQFECVYSAEIDPYACKTYEDNFGENPFRDLQSLTLSEIKQIPQFDLLTAGFPCQPFSICGRQEGFSDATRGTLFFNILQILKEKQPSYVLLENVAHLLHHQEGYTWSIIKASLEELGYKVHYQIVNSSHFGVPQHRERLFIICTPPSESFVFPTKIEPFTYLHSILETNGPFTTLSNQEYTLIEEPKLSPNHLFFVGYLNKNRRLKGVREEALHLSRNHKQPNRIYSDQFLHPTLTASESSGRYYILTEQGVRKLLLEECFRLQGFPEQFKKNVSTSQLYKQIGNSVTVPVISALGKQLIACSP